MPLLGHYPDTNSRDLAGHFNSYLSAMSQTMAGKAGGSTSDGLKVDVFGYDIRCHESP